MSTTCMTMIIRKNGMNFIVSYTSTNNVIKTYIFSKGMVLPIYNT
jgi:hypothetical protein